MGMELFEIVILFIKLRKSKSILRTVKLFGTVLSINHSSYNNEYLNENGHSVISSSIINLKILLKKYCSL